MPITYLDVPEGIRMEGKHKRWEPSTLRRMRPTRAGFAVRDLISADARLSAFDRFVGRLRMRRTLPPTGACPRRPGVALLGSDRIHARSAQETTTRARRKSSIFLQEDNRLNVYAGELEVRPPTARTTKAVGRCSPLGLCG
jgi:hypothetical protein